jgi:hypothetical protein
VSNEAVVKPADIRAGRQRLGHSQTEFGALLNPSSPPSLGGSEERKRPKDFRRIIGCAARRRLLEVDTLARLKRVALDLGAVRTTETRNAARARSGGFEYDPPEAGQFFEIAAVQSRALGLQDGAGRRSSQWSTKRSNALRPLGFDRDHLPARAA